VDATSSRRVTLIVEDRLGIEPPDISDLGKGQQVFSASTTNCFG